MALFVTTKQELTRKYLDNIRKQITSLLNVMHAIQIKIEVKWRPLV